MLAYEPDADTSPDTHTARGRLQWRGRELYFGELWVGEVMQWNAGVQMGKWRAWVTTEAPGAHHGWFGSEGEARRQAETVVCRALAMG